jgi:hygromycin-B 7''-O-kinase
MKLKPELHLSRDKAQSIVDLAVSQQRVATVSRLHGGEIAAVYEIAFTEPASPPLVLKLYPEDLHWKMQKEVTVLQLIAGRLSVSVPRILFADDSKRLLELNWTLMTKLDGSILGQLETALPEAQRHCAYVQIGELLREFHCISMQAFGYIGANGIWTPYQSNHAYLTNQFSRKLKDFVERRGDAGLARRITKYLDHRDGLLSACTSAVLCHNDLHAGNLLARASDEKRV